MIKYEYQILRYVHDQTTGEFVNIGIVVFEPETGFLKASVLDDFSRVSNFFEVFNDHHLRNTLTQFQKQLESMQQFFNLEESLSANEESVLATITGRIILNDDSALQLTEVKQGLDLNAYAALDDLFARLVGKYNPPISLF